jgi:hypothetical protein
MIRAKDAKLLNVYKDGTANVLCVLEETPRSLGRFATVAGGMWSMPSMTELQHVGGSECWAEVVKAVVR